MTNQRFVYSLDWGLFFCTICQIWYFSAAMKARDKSKDTSKVIKTQTQIKIINFGSWEQLAGAMSD
jgi:hypothetical protein